MVFAFRIRQRDSFAGLYRMRFNFAFFLRLVWKARGW